MLLIFSCEANGQYTFEFNKKPIHLREFRKSLSYKKQWGDTLVIFFNNGFQDNVTVEVNHESIFNGFIKTDDRVGLAKVVKTIPLEAIQQISIRIENNNFEFSPVSNSNYYYISKIKSQQKIEIYHGDVVPLYE